MSLEPRTRRLARLSAAIVLGRWDELRRVRGLAVDGEPDRAWREAVLQTHLFAGFPRLVEAYGVLDDAGGLGEPEPGEQEDERDVESRGRGLFERIYGAESERVRGDLERRQPLFARWIEQHAYGRVLSRPGLDPATRELLAVCALAATGQDRQLASHARGAVRCGARADELLEALTVVGDLLDEERFERCLRVVRRFE